MKLPIPVFTSSNVYTDIEITKPRASVIADTRKTLDMGGGPFTALKQFIGGSIESISSEDKAETDKMAIKNIVASMPYRSAEYVSLQILILNDPEIDAVEGIYPCPRCGHRIMTELIKNDDYEIDTRDYISMLPVNYMEDPINSISLDLSEPVIIKNKRTDEVIDTISSMTMRHPTLADCIVADKKYGSSDNVRAQFAMYVEALLTINEKEVDKKYKNTYGMFVFENIRDARKDLRSLNESITSYGIDTKIEKTCTQCGKVWLAEISFANFFVSGLAL